MAVTYLGTRLILVGVLAYAAAAQAELGSDSRSIAADAAQLQAGEINLQQTERYQVHSFSTPSGVQVREYVSGGRVVAIRWSGPVPPDMQVLLGTHFSAYTAALASLARPGLQRSVHLLLPEVTVDLSGHLRAYQGRAYLSTIGELGLKPEDLK